MTTPRCARILSDLNKAFGPIAEWVGLIGIVASLIAREYAMAYGFLGLLLTPRLMR